MARYVIDAATLVHIVTEQVDVAAAHRLVAPNLVRTEALALLLAAVRRGEMAERAALEHHERLTALKIRLLGDRVSRRTAWRIAMEHGIDDLVVAEYLAVCRLQADALVTVDPALAATAEGIVELAPVGALADG